MKVQRAAVVGAGAMGSGIAQVLSQAGIEVILKDVKQEYVDKGLANIKRMYDSRVKKEVLSQAEADYLYGQIKGTTTYEGFNNLDIVIEAALEEINVKLDIFKELDAVCPSKTILATNTSALSISEIASATKRPDKVVGMHFFNPAQTMKLVEVIPGVKTSPESVAFAVDLCRDVHKVAVKVKECPGFLVNRLLFPYMNESLWALQDEAGTPEEIDKAVVAFGMPMGPFTLFDMTGIDICAHVNAFLYGEYGPRFQPAPLIKLMIESGFLGQKSGKGFYVHEQGQIPAKDKAKEVNPELKKLIEKAQKLAGDT
ncbi:MAG TPA: 3-hydroxyacyl-CoA dehydrogenase family protein, partial [Candidatus Obscuribacterales bacterium]